MAAVYAHAVTVRSPMGVLQVDPLNSQSIDLLKRAEELLSMDAVKEIITDDKIVRLGDHTGSFQISR
jgi:hypothetical protein